LLRRGTADPSGRMEVERLDPKALKDARPWEKSVEVNALHP
jgi:hypothetical protein